MAEDCQNNTVLLFSEERKIAARQVTTTTKQTHYTMFTREQNLPVGLGFTLRATFVLLFNH